MVLDLLAGDLYSDHISVDPSKMIFVLSEGLVFSNIVQGLMRLVVTGHLREANLLFCTERKCTLAIFDWIFEYNEYNADLFFFLELRTLLMQRIIFY